MKHLRHFYDLKFIEMRSEGTKELIQIKTLTKKHSKTKAVTSKCIKWHSKRLEGYHIATSYMYHIANRGVPYILFSWKSVSQK